MKHLKNLVVARYNEDIEWTKQFSNVFNVIIYNKGEKLNVPNEIMMDNVGREGHTYYKYIVDNYDNLPEYTIFLQGHPFDHSPNIIQNLSICAKPSWNRPFKFLSETIHKNNLDFQKGYYPQCEKIYDTHEFLFNSRKNRKITFGPGAQFMVSRDRILSRSKEYYEKIVKLLDYSSNPMEGHHIERFHSYIFNSS
jgi:hypothetical protein